MTKEEMQAIIALQETYIEDLQQDGANTDVAKSVLAKNRAELSYYSVTEELDELRARLAEVEAQRDLLAIALPDDEKLDLLADWIDLNFPDDENPEVQADLRRWARSAREALAKLEEK